jgi:hypothetical protein
MSLDTAFCHCGLPLDDFNEVCICALDTKPARKKRPISWSMRSMVAKKLARQEEEIKNAG